MERAPSLNITSTQVLSLLDSGSIQLPGDSQLDNMDALKQNSLEVNQQLSPSSLYTYA